MNQEAVNQQHLAATSGAGVVSLPDWSTVRTTGNDRASFLHNMCTNDIRGLSPEQGCEAFFTDVKGKIVAHAFVLAGNDDVRLILPGGEGAALIAHLDRYIIREDVQLVDASSDVSWLMVFGQQAGGAMERCFSAGASDFAIPWSHRWKQLDEIEVQLVRCDLPWCGGYLIGCGPNKSNEIRRRMIDGGAIDAAESIWHAIRVESTWPVWGVDFDAANLPQEVGRDAMAIHFRKGCYLGQETIARIDALGHVNKRLALIQFSPEASPKVGAELFQGEQVVGRVTSATWSPRTGGPLGLAMVRRDANQVGAELRCEDAGAKVVPGESPPR